LWYRVVMHVDHDGEAITGVAYILGPFGGKDTYHFAGSFKDGKIVASHYSGHVFRGDVVSAQEIAGELEAASGERLSMKAYRR
jgi:hypothetical protein